MKKIICTLIFLNFFNLLGYCSVYTDQEIIAALDINLFEEIYIENGDIVLNICITNVLEKREGCFAGWYKNDMIIEDYSNSNFDIYEGKKSELILDIPNHSNQIENISFIITLNGFSKEFKTKVDIGEYINQQNIDRVFTSIKPVEIEATIKYWTYVYSDKTMRQKAGHFIKGDKVSYFDQYNRWSAYVKYGDKYYWVPYSSLNISNKNYTLYSDISSQDKELFVNAKGYKSNTDYLVWLNLQRQKVNVFTMQEGKWMFEKAFTCATGANNTPTPMGEFTYSSNISGWYFSTYYVKPVLYFIESRQIAFHSRLYRYNGTLSDATIGRPVSHACVRMLDEDVNWLKDYLQIGTKIIVY